MRPLHLATLILLALSFVPATAAHAAPVRLTPEQRAAAATFAEGKVGAPYRWGAIGPRAFDCSGLVTFAYRAARAPLNVRTTSQLWNVGAHVQRAALQRGDIVWVWDARRGHVGMYLGAGRYVHAPSPGRRVTIAALPSASHYFGAVRP